MSHERAVHDPQPARRGRDDDEQRRRGGAVSRPSWLPRHRPTRWLLVALTALPFALLHGGHNGATLVGVIAAVTCIASLIAEASTTTKGTS